jgi:hypothetical protein
MKGVGQIIERKFHHQKKMILISKVKLRILNPMFWNKLRKELKKIWIKLLRVCLQTLKSGE